MAGQLQRHKGWSVMAGRDPCVNEMGEDSKHWGLFWFALVWFKLKFKKIKIKKKKVRNPHFTASPKPGDIKHQRPELFEENGCN